MPRQITEAYVVAATRIAVGKAPRGVYRHTRPDDLLAHVLRSVRIIAPIPGKSTVGVEVPNQDQETVRLRELIESGVHDEKGLAIPLFLGKDATGNPLVADLARIAGTS